MNLTTRTSLTALATLCSAAAIAPATASATTLTTYKAEVAATASWSYSQHLAGSDWSFGSGGWFDWTTVVDVGELRFADGHLVGVTARGKGQQMAVGKVTAEHHDESTGATGGSCDLNDQPHDGAVAQVGKPDWAKWSDETAAVAISDSEVSLPWKCEGKVQPTTPFTFGTEPLEHDDTFGHRPLDAVFEIPREVVGFGKIIQNVEGPPAESAGYCPEKWYDGVERCSFSWRGTVTLVKTGEQALEEPSPAALGETPSAPPASPPSDSDDEKLAPLVVPAANATTDAKASKVTFTATCPTGCSGTAALSVGAHGSASAAAARTKPVARMAFRVKPGRNRAVTLKLPAKARRALRRTRRGTLRVTLKKPGKLAVVKTLSVKVPRR